MICKTPNPGLKLSSISVSSYSNMCVTVASITQTQFKHHHLVFQPEPQNGRQSQYRAFMGLAYWEQRQVTSWWPPAATASCSLHCSPPSAARAFSCLLHCKVPLSLNHLNHQLSQFCPSKWPGMCCICSLLDLRHALWTWVRQQWCSTSCRNACRKHRKNSLRTSA